MFVVEYHMERFSNKLGHKYVGSLADDFVQPEEIGRKETYNDALGIAYDHLYTMFPLKDMVEVEMRRGELVGFLKDSPSIENHYKIIPISD